MEAHSKAHFEAHVEAHFKAHFKAHVEFANNPRLTRRHMVATTSRFSVCVLSVAEIPILGITVSRQRVAN